MGAAALEDRRGENYNFSFAVGAFHDASEWAALALAVALLLSVGEIRFQDTHNRPGILYSTEAGVFDPAWSTSNPTIAAAAQADFGTRLKADFRGIPSGAQFWLSVTAVNQNSSRAAELTSSESGPFHQVSATRTLTNGAGIFGTVQVPVTSGAADTVWEVTGANPARTDSYDFPVWIVLPSLKSIHRLA